MLFEKLFTLLRHQGHETVKSLSFDLICGTPDMWGDENDEELLRALEESRRLYEEVEVPRLSQQCFNNPVSSTNRDFGPVPGPSSDVQPSTSKDTFKRPSLPPAPQDDGDIPEELYDGVEAEGFDFKAGKHWSYPTSEKFPVRTYQRDIVEKALFNNTLVSLPTGLGKTFIAAAVMYNFYVWYPKGKIIFMAPTKPLVAQQVENCINIMGIPQSHTAQMTGAINSKIRAVTWKEKRVFFLTPQVVQNDLTASVCPANAVKCVVIDEAHRALGDHAYAQVIRLLNSYGARYRILALSATPGSDLEAVQKVVSNLMINHIELRTEESPDIVQYTHQRNVELMVVDVGPTINRIKARFVAIAGSYAERLHKRKLLFGNIGTISKFTVLKEWQQFQQEGSKHMDPSVVSQISNDFSIVHTLVHGLELLQTYGLRLLLNHLKGVIDKNDPNGRRLAVNEDVRSLMSDIESHLNPIDIDDENSNDGKKRCIYGHPKLDRLQEVVVSHFESFEQKGNATRAIVFCEYREGVIEICDMLKHFEPLIKPVVFMGQSMGKTSKGISQKQQLEIMEKFKKGVYNTLISTSVGEEGLDIGEVDLIICFDAKNSPIRQVQRMGRTGRKREGRIIMLVTRGKEEQKYNLGLHKKKNVGAVLLNRENLAGHLFEDCPKMLPPGVKPTYVERFLVPTTNKAKSNQQDLRKMFSKRNTDSGSGTSKPSTSSRPLNKMPFLSEADFDDLKMSLNVLECCNFDRIPTRTEFWSKSPDEVIGKDLSPNNIDLSTYVEFMRFQQRTHVVGNSSESKLLSDLLSWADDKRDSDQAATCGGFSSQVTSTQLWPTKLKKRGRPPALDAKATNPLKKRGRPRKDVPKSGNSLLIDQVASEDDQKSNQPLKIKRPQFIEDDEDFSPTLPDPPQAPEISTSIFIVPPRPGMPIDKTKCEPTVDDPIITLDSDEEVDLNSTSSSGYAGLSSDVSRQDLYSRLSKALKKQSIEEEEECIICDNLFPCSSLNKLSFKNKKKNVTWKDMSKSLEEVLKLLPLLKCGGLSKHSFKTYKSENMSQEVLSLVPKHEIFADDELNDGLLCGGLGDLSPPAVSPAATKLSPHVKISSSSRSNVGEDTENNGNSLKDSKKIEDNRDASVKHEFEDTSFDFLGLSKFEDMLDSSSVKKEDIRSSCDQSTKNQSLEPSPGKKFELQQEDEALWSENNVFVKVSSPTKSQETSSKPIELVSDCKSPERSNIEIGQPASPILCSQLPKKPRSMLRLQKRPSHGENSASKVQILSKDSDEIMKPTQDNHRLCRLTPEDEIVSSSCQQESERHISPAKLDFDLFDNSLFPLSGDNRNNESKVDESLKAAILNKAHEAKGKQPNITFTQELREMCETTMGGLTQMLDLLESKTNSKSPEVQFERADSSSSPQQPEVPLNPHVMVNDDLNKAKVGDDIEALWGSEEDLFAEYDDVNLHHADSLVPISSKEVGAHGDNPLRCDVEDPVFSHNNNNDSNTVNIDTLCNRDTDKSRENLNHKFTETVNPERSSSPVFKSSQMPKRASKLSLKKNKNSATEVANAQASEKSSVHEMEKEIPSEKGPADELIDFSMFGDEFNNSWLQSQDCDKAVVEDTASCDSRTINIGLKGTTNLIMPEGKNGNTSGSTLHNLSQSIQHQMSTEVFRVMKECDSHICQSDEQKENRKSISTETKERYENEFDEAFAELDAVMNERNKSLRKNSCSTPKSTAKTNTTQKTIPRTLGARQGPNEIFLSSSDDESVNKHCKNQKKSSLNISSSLESKRRLHPLQNENKLMSHQNDDLERKRKRSTLLSSSSTESVTRNCWLSPKSIKINGEGNDTNRVFRETEKDKNIITLSSSDDDDSILKHSKGKKAPLNITSSSEEGLNLQNHDESVFNVKSDVGKKRKHKVIQSSSSNESLCGKGWLSTKPNKVPRKERSANVHDKNRLLNLSSFCDVSILNELEDEEEDKEEDSQMSTDDDEDFQSKAKDSTKTKHKNKRKKHSKKRNCFIVSEAEESDDNAHNSSDGETTSLDELDSSFINDSQPEASQSVTDIHAKYLQSVRSPAAGGGRFKIPNRLPHMNMDVYSQYPDPSEMDQTYGNDSFVVDNEATQYENSEMSLLEIAEAKLKAEKREKNKSKKSLKYGAGECIESGGRVEKKVKQQKKSRLRRIQVLENSTSGEEEVHSTSNQNTPTNQNDIGGCLNTSSSLQNRTEAKKQDNDFDFANLLDDDFDFNVVPEVSAPSNNVTGASGTSSSSKFVKKVPFALRGSHCASNVMSAAVPLATHIGANDRPNMFTENKAPAACSNRFTENKASSGFSTRFTENRASLACSTRVSENVAPSKHNQSTHTSDPTGTLNNEKAMIPTSSIVKVFIIASSRQVAASTDVIRVLRIEHGVHIIPRSVPNADFIISWRLGVKRIFASDLRDRRKIEEEIKKLRLSYNKPFVIVEKDRVKKLASFSLAKKKKLNGPPCNTNTGPTPNSPSLWITPTCCHNAALLRQVGVSLLFSQDKDETARFLANLAKKETGAGHGIPDYSDDFSEEVECRLQFFTSLPGINLAFALKLATKFPILADFFERCSSVSQIATTLGVDVNVAREIHKLLCEVHVIP